MRTHRHPTPAFSELGGFFKVVLRNKPESGLGKKLNERQRNAMAHLFSIFFLIPKLFPISKKRFEINFLFLGKICQIK